MDRVKFLLLGLILLGCIIVPLATKAAVRDLTDRQVAMLLPPLWLAPVLPGAPRSHLGDIEAPYRADGIATADIDLDTGGHSIILDDGATGAGNGAIYFGQDTDLSLYRVGVNKWGVTGNFALHDGYLFLSTTDTNTHIRQPAEDYIRFFIGNEAINFIEGTDDHVDFGGFRLQLGLDPATDTARAGSTIKTANAYSQAETNTTGGPLYLGGGVGTKEIKIVQASASGSTLTFVVDGTSTTITTDTEWNCTTDDATCCAELETYLDANIAGFTATCDTVDEVYLDPATTTRTLNLTSADAAGTKFVVVNGANGGVLVAGDGDNNYPAIGSLSSNDGTGTGIYWSSVGTRLNLTANGTLGFQVYANSLTGFIPFDQRSYIFDALGALALGAACDAAGTTGNVCVGGALLTVDNALQLDGTATFAVPPVFAGYTRHHDVPIGAAIVGAAAPAVETIGTFRCKVFDANADLAYINVEVPSEWNGTSDMAIDLLIFTDQGDALGNGETIEFDLVYRSVAVGEAYDNGTAVTITSDVSGGASEVDKGQYNITATVDYDNVNQPLAVNDTLGFSLMRDVTTGDTYSGDVHVCRAQLVYTANALATH